MKDLRSFRIILWSGFVGTFLEWYDFAVYGFLAPVLSPLFFPHNRPVTSLLMTYSVFAIGYLARPLGGVIFGRWGDIHGRKSILIITVLLMAIPSFLMGCLPTYERWGVVAPILMVLLRLLQGIAAGGETMGAVIFVYESAPRYRQSFATSFLYVGTGFGILLGSFVTALCLHAFTEPGMAAYGWRIPFWLSALTAVVGVLIRVKTQESDAFLEMKKTNAHDFSPLKVVWKEQKSNVLRMMSLFAPNAILFYVGFVFMPAILVKLYPSLASAHVYTVNTVATAALLVLCIVFGGVADRWRRKLMLMIGFGVTFCIIIPLYGLLDHPSMLRLVCVQGGLALMVAWVSGPLMAFVLSQIPVSVRYSTAALSYNLTYSLLGGTAPLMGVVLFHWTGSFLGIAVYLMAFLLLAMVSLSTLLTAK